MTIMKIVFIIYFRLYDWIKAEILFDFSEDLKFSPENGAGGKLPVLKSEFGSVGLQEDNDGFRLMYYIYSLISFYLDGLDAFLGH